MVALSFSELSDFVEENLKNAEEEISLADSLVILEQLKSKYLGKSGVFTTIIRSINDLPNEDKPLLGKLINKAKEHFLGFLQNKIDFINTSLINLKLQEEAIDVTLPGEGMDLGSLHPITKVRQRMEELFASIGFLVLNDDPRFSLEIEDVFHNFDALNTPMHHPARAATDTFYLENSAYLLRTQTSPAQIRALEVLGVPLRVIVPGRVYRRDFDATHVPMFHQLEGLLVSENASFAELKGILYDFLTKFFEREIKLRFRPSYFPFTEPSAEVDLQCIACTGDGRACKLCKGSGWIEVFGCGMVHPNVLQAANIDSEKYTGFAFGFGIDRFAMFRYGIDDLRLMLENDLRFLEQF